MARRGRPKHPDVLTPREWEVLGLLQQGLSNPEIAARLGIGREGAKYHVSEILGKLGVSTREEAALWHTMPSSRWLAVLAPLTVPLKWRPLATVVAGAVLAASVGGLVLLAILLIRNETSSSYKLVLSTDLPVSLPTPAQERAVYSLDLVAAKLEPLPVPTLLDPSELSPDGSSIIYNAGPALLLSDLEGATRSIDRSRAGAEVTDWSNDGTTLLLVSSEGLKSLELATDKVTLVLSGNVQNAVWSPDEKQIAFVQDQRLGVFNVDDGSARMIAPGLNAMYLPYYYGRGYLAWSPDGTRIAFGNWTAEHPVTQGRSDIYVVNSNGTNLRRLTDSPRAKSQFSWSPDGDAIAYLHSLDDGDHLQVLDVDTGGPLPVDIVSLRPPIWLDSQTLLQNDYAGLSAVSLDGATRSLVAADPACSTFLIGEAGWKAVFIYNCAPGL